jgi:hypothetical protein
LLFDLEPKPCSGVVTEFMVRVMTFLLGIFSCSRMEGVMMVRGA